MSVKKDRTLVFFVPSLDGGVGRVIALLASGMRADGEKVEVWSAAPRGGHANKLEQTISVKYIGNGAVSSSFFSLIRRLRTHTPTALISASFHANCVAILASIFSRTSTQFIIADHPSVDAALQELSFLKRTLWRVLISILYPISDKYIAVSNGVAKAMSKYGGVDQRQIVVIPNPVISDEIFTLGSIKTHHPFFNSSKPTLLYVGRLSYEKDVPNLIQAFAKAQSCTPPRLIIVGDGPDRPQLEDLVRQKHLDDKVSFLGHQDNPYPYFAQSDLLVLSSTREGLPTVLIEALAFGLKITSTDCPSGPREILNNGAYGQLVKPGDSEMLANAIVLSLNSSNPIVPEHALEQYKVKSAVKAYKKLIYS